jgi:phenylalanyl-tRNA synthetase alpha subunit
MSRMELKEKEITELRSLLEGIVSVIGDFTNTMKKSSDQLEKFTKAIDTKILSLNAGISQLAEVIKEEDKKLSQNLNSLIDGVKNEIESYKNEIKISDFKEILDSLQKIVTIPEKQVINKTVDQLMKEILEIAQELKKR